VKKPAQKTNGSGIHERTVAGLILKEREITCPHCHIVLIVGSPINTIFRTQRTTCPNCGKEFPVVPMTSAEYDDRQEAA